MQNIISVNLLIFLELGLAIYFSGLFMCLTSSDPLLSPRKPSTLRPQKSSDFCANALEDIIFIIKFKLIVLFNIVWRHHGWLIDFSKLKLRTKRKPTQLFAVPQLLGKCWKIFQCKIHEIWQSWKDECRFEIALYLRTSSTPQKLWKQPFFLASRLRLGLGMGGTRMEETYTGHFLWCGCWIPRIPSCLCFTYEWMYS